MSKRLSSKDTFIISKTDQILKEGVRRNTHKPLSKSNQRRPVQINQARAIAHSMYDRRNA